MIFKIPIPTTASSPQQVVDRRRRGGRLAGRGRLATLSKFPPTRLQYEGDNDVDAIFCSFQLRLAPTTTTTTSSSSSYHSVLDDSWMQCRFSSELGNMDSPDWPVVSCGRLWSSLSSSSSSSSAAHCFWTARRPPPFHAADAKVGAYPCQPNDIVVVIVVGAAN